MAAAGRGLVNEVRELDRAGKGWEGQATGVGLVLGLSQAEGQAGDMGTVGRVELFSSLGHAQELPSPREEGQELLCHRQSAGSVV